MKEENYCGVSRNGATFVFAEPHFIEALRAVKDRLYIRLSGSSIEYCRSRRASVKFSTNFKNGGYVVQVSPWYLFRSAEDGNAWLVPFPELALPTWELVAARDPHVILHGEILSALGARARLCERDGMYFYTKGGMPHSPMFKDFEVVENWARRALWVEDAVTAYQRVSKEDRRNFLQRVCDVSIDIKFK